MLDFESWKAGPTCHRKALAWKSNSPEVARRVLPVPQSPTPTGLAIIDERNGIMEEAVIDDRRAGMMAGRVLTVAVLCAIVLPASVVGQACDTYGPRKECGECSSDRTSCPLTHIRPWDQLQVVFLIGPRVSRMPRPWSARILLNLRGPE
jgi:hypothetical protein